MIQINPLHRRNDKDVLLLKMRLCVSGFSTLYLMFLALVLIPIDFSLLDEPKLNMYERVKYKLLTTWVNLMMLAYYPASFYCDWRELQGGAGNKQVQVMNKVRHAGFSNVLFPATMVADTLFWRLWMKDRELVAPVQMDDHVPSWTYHSLHTVSLVLLILDLLLVPRKKPRSTKRGLAMLLSFVTMYILMCMVSYLQGDNIYPMFSSMSVSSLIMFTMLVYIEHLLFFTVQWPVIDSIWGNSRMKNKTL